VTGRGTRAGRIVLITALVALTAALAIVPGRADDSETFPPERIKSGAAIFARNCAPCHGPRMRDPESAFNLRSFPRDQHARFVAAVTRGKNNMPPWGDLLKPEDIEALWAYVIAGEKG
jgi:mono/diheme cytochrome c family protein